MVPSGFEGDEPIERRWKWEAAQLTLNAQSAEAARRTELPRALPDAPGLWWTVKEIRKRVALATGS
jgi:hypothetical protein